MCSTASNEHSSSLFFFFFQFYFFLISSFLFITFSDACLSLTRSRSLNRWPLTYSNFFSNFFFFHSSFLIPYSQHMRMRFLRYPKEGLLYLHPILKRYQDTCDISGVSNGKKVYSGWGIEKNGASGSHTDY